MTQNLTFQNIPPELITLDSLCRLRKFYIDGISLSGYTIVMVLRDQQERMVRSGEDGKMDKMENNFSIKNQ